MYMYLLHIFMYIHTYLHTYIHTYIHLLNFHSIYCYDNIFIYIYLFFLYIIRA